MRQAAQKTSCSAATVPTKGKPTVGDDEALTRDGRRSSRHASEAAGGMMMRLADLEAARQQREEALTAFSETTPVVTARPWGGINNDETTEHEGSERQDLRSGVFRMDLNTADLPNEVSARSLSAWTRQVGELSFSLTEKQQQFTGWRVGRHW